MRRLFLLLPCLALALLAGLPGFGQGPQKRVALLIGNAAYETRPLPNCRNDVQAMAVALRGLGFSDVEVVTDATLDQMTDALAAFKRKATDALAVVYYSGHGVQSDGKNYLIPVGARIASKGQLRSRALDLQEVLDELEAAKYRVVILDACRDDPLPAEAKSGKKGLIPLRGPLNSLVAFAASDGQTADVNVAGKLSIYTEELLKNLTLPGLDLERIFKRTLAAVADRTANAQVPDAHNRLRDDIILRPGAATEIPTLGARVRVTSTPPGARILVGGTDTGQETPAVVLVPGSGRGDRIRIELRKAGMRPAAQQVSVIPGAEASAEFRLQRLDEFDNELGDYPRTRPVNRGQLAILIHALLTDRPLDLARFKGSSEAVAARTGQIPDVPSGHWAHEAVEYCVSRQLLGAYPDGLFRPARTATRYEAAVLLHNAALSFERESGLRLPLPRRVSSPPRDVPADHWAHRSVDFVANTWLLRAYPDGEFRGARPLTVLEIEASLKGMRTAITGAG